MGPEYEVMDNPGNSNLENVIDKILFSAKGLKQKLETLKEGSEGDGADVGPRQLIDHKRVKALERENIELRQALEDHQYGLEFIMSKYRSQIIELIRLKKEENSTPPHTMRNDEIR